ncbi:MAG: bifunctional 5,10-methylenetetrahydrofolate dehydrogenase/5,10-methenyltetrahydrofolate cyclohydrolase [Candidatus Coprovivens sp.]
MKLLSGKELRDIKINELKNKLNKLDKKLTLAIISVDNDEASLVYVKQKRIMAEELNINLIDKHFINTSNEEVINYINDLNKDNNVNGIIVQLPLPEYLNKELILNTIDYKKDVDGLTLINSGKLSQGVDCIIPCTPKGIIDLIDYYNINIKGKNIVVIGRSNLVGRPIASLLTSKDATVTITHSKTHNLKELCKEAEILIVATGKCKLINKEYVKDGAIIIDVGIHNINGKICGDVDFDSVKDIVSYITPVPGGVGPMTVYELFNNVYEAYIMYK